MSLAAAQPQQGGRPVTGSREVPIQKEKDPRILAIASFLRNHRLLKMRQGTINGQPVEFFRYKRCIRALTSQEYQDKAAKLNLPQMPDLLNNPIVAQQVFVGLISNQLVVPIQKLSTQDARKRGFKPKRDQPCFVPEPKCVLADDKYFHWTFTPPNPYLPLYSFLGIVAILTLICFPLWPLFMRRGAWYLSMLALGLIGAIFVIAIIRLILYIVLSPFTKFWLFPNLFADVGFVDSFKPLYEFEVPKPKKSKSSSTADSASIVHNSNATASAIKATGAKSKGEASSAATKRKVTLEEVAE